MELRNATVYASGLFQLAEELDRVDEIRDEIEAVDQTIKSEPDFRKVLINPAIQKSSKKQILENVFKGRVSDEMISFLKILVDKQRIGELHTIAHAFYKMVDDKRGLDYGEIWSRVPLSDEQIKKFETEAGNLLGKNVELENKIDESLLGGVKLFVGGKVIDASIAARLEEITRRMKDI